MHQLPTLVRRLISLALVTLALSWIGACASDAGQSSGDEAIASVSSAVTFLPKTTELGNTSVAVGADVTHTERGVWHDVNRLATGVWSRAGDALQITVSGEVAGPGSLYLRAFVDDTLASPSDVQFFVSGSEKTGARSFTFLMAPSGVDGFHLVRVQWMSTSDFTMRDRTLVVRSVPTASGGGAQMSYAVGPSDRPLWLFKGWTDIPHLATNVVLRTEMDLQITFSAETFTHRRRLLARALIDGVPALPSDVTMEQEDHLAEGTRSMTFTARNVKPGAHNVRIQCATDAGGEVGIGDRTLSVIGSVRRATSGGMDNRFRETAPVEIRRDTWESLMNAAVDIGTTPGASIVTTVSLEHLVSGKGALHMRMLVDDRVMEPEDVTLDRNPSLHTQAFSFGSKDFRRSGLIGVTLQFRIDSSETSAQVRDVSLATSAVRRTGSDFAQAQPFESFLVPRQGAVPLVTICLDPLRPNQPPLTNTEVVNMVDGPDGRENIRDLFAEMSERRFMLASHTVLGCGTPRFYHPPPARQGTWYWDAPDRFGQMRIDAFAEAQIDFDFAQYDADHDGELEPHELAIMICIPQQAVSGSARGGTYTLNGQSLRIRETVDCYIPAKPDDGGRRVSVGVIGHELGHVLLTTPDFYPPTDAPLMNEMPGPFSLMGTGAAVHLEAYHKMHSGWIGPSLVDMTAWVTGDIALGAIESSRDAVIIYDPTRNNREFFMIENRYRGQDLPWIFNYDRFLDVNLGPTPGPVLWHIVERFADLDPSHPPPTADPATWPERLNEHGWKVGGIQRWGILTPGTSIPLKWADGTSAGMTAIGGSVGSTSVVKLQK